MVGWTAAISSITAPLAPAADAATRSPPPAARATTLPPTGDAAIARMGTTGAPATRAGASRLQHADAFSLAAAIGAGSRADRVRSLLLRLRLAGSHDLTYSTGLRLPRLLPPPLSAASSSPGHSRVRVGARVPGTLGKGAGFSPSARSRRGRRGEGNGNRWETGVCNGGGGGGVGGENWEGGRVVLGYVPRRVIWRAMRRGSGAHVDFIERQGKKVTRACAVDGLDSSGFCVFFLLFLLRLDYRFWIKATGTFCTGKFWTPSVLKKKNVQVILSRSP